MPGRSITPSSLMVLKDLFVRTAAVVMADFKSIQDHWNAKWKYGTLRTTALRE
jgi:hypothetical protein